MFRRKEGGPFFLWCIVSIRGEKEKRGKRNACPLLKWSYTKEIDVAKKDWFRILLNSLGYMNECLYVDDVIEEMMIVRLWPIIMNIRFTIYDLEFM